jgi:hypothetical protein
LPVHQRKGGFHKGSEFQKLRSIDGKGIAKGNGFNLNGITEMQSCGITDTCDRHGFRRGLGTAETKSIEQD